MTGNYPCLITMNPKFLAELYLNGDSVNPTDSEISTFRAWIEQEFKIIPCPVDFVYQDVDLPQTERIYHDHNVLAISVLNCDHPFLTFRENAKFRAVHDWHHISRGYDSSLSGEIQSFEFARLSAPISIWWILHSEIVLQAAAMLYTGEFQPQKFANALTSLRYGAYS